MSSNQHVRTTECTNPTRRVEGGLLGFSATCLATFAATGSIAQVTHEGAVTEYQSRGTDATIDFKHAKPKPMPVNPLPPPSQEELLRQGKGAKYPGPPQASHGSDGPP